VCRPALPTTASNIFGDFTRPRAYYWSDFKSGFLINVKRIGNRFIATTSELE
jgi:hypothetical protein